MHIRPTLATLYRNVSLCFLANKATDITLSDFNISFEWFIYITLDDQSAHSRVMSLRVHRGHLSQGPSFLSCLLDS